MKWWKSSFDKELERAKEAREARRQEILDAGPKQSCPSRIYIDGMSSVACEAPFAADEPHQHRGMYPWNPPERHAAAYGAGFGNPWEDKWATEQVYEWISERPQT